MIVFQVDDMTCGHCVSSVMRAVKGLDAVAEVQIDLARHRVSIEPGRATAQQLAAAIQDAGFTPLPLPA
jgi:copper chaperone